MNVQNLFDPDAVNFCAMVLRLAGSAHDASEVSLRGRPCSSARDLLLRVETSVRLL